MSPIELLKIEWRKFHKSPVIRLLVILYALLTPFIIFAGKKMFSEDVRNELPISTDIFYEFPTVWEYQGYISSWVAFVFLSFIAIHIFCSEVRNKTMRQSIINGMTRKDYFLSKVLSILVISIAATVFYYLTCLAIGFAHTPNPDFSKLWNNDMAGFRFFLSTMGHLSFAFFLAVLVKRAGIALFLFLSYVVMLEPGLKWLIYFQVTETWLINYFPLNTMEDLFPFPPYKFADAIPDEINITLLLSHNQAMIFAAIYIVVFLVWAYRIFLKRDL